MTLKDQLLALGIKTLLAYHSRPGAIHAALANRTYRHADPLVAERVTLGVVQMQADLLADGAAFAEKYYGLVRQAVERGAQLIVFPEYAWLPILGLLPPVRTLAQQGVTLQGAVDALAPNGGMTLDGVFRTIAPAVQRIFETTARELAKRFGVWLMPGSALTMDAHGHLFNTAYLYAPDGRLLGTQNKLHATTLEKTWLTTGNDLRVFDLPFAKIAMPVCMDFTYWETTRIATLHGAEILLDLSADETADQLMLAVRGDESRAQESLAYTARAYCVTKLFGLNFCGPSHIAAPLGLRGNGSVYLAQTESSDRAEVIVADLDLARLRQFRAEHPRDYNLALDQKYLPSAYAAYRARVTQDGKRRLT